MPTRYFWILQIFPISLSLSGRSREAANDREQNMGRFFPRAYLPHTDK